MSEDIEGIDSLESEAGLGQHSFMDIFEELSFKDKWAKVKWGLSQPKDSGDYKYAKLQLLRLLAPFLAVVVPIFFVGLMVVFAAINPPPPPAAEVTVVEPEVAPDLEEIEPIKEEPPEPPEPVDMDFTPDVTAMDTPNPSPPTDFSPMPAQFDSVAIVKSPVIMKNIYGSRNPGARGSLIAGYGGSGAGEICVLRALRWLKKNQEANGSWGGTSAYNGANNKGQGGANTAYTSMALLTYLAHGETPASEEFGATVEKAIKFLVNDQTADGRFKSKDGHEYTLPIAAYALSEAYGLTKVPMLKEAAEKAIKIVVAGQHPSGGWDYNCKQTERDDTSYMGWCAQSLKAAKMAGLDVPNLVTAINKAPDGFRKNCNASVGSFGYTGAGAANVSGLSGVGVLCMQLMGQAGAAEVKAGVNHISQKSKVGWNGTGVGNIYYWYYDTQAMFHTGGDLWKAWNAVFSPQLVENQTVEKNAIEDTKGKMVDIGYWDGPSVHHSCRVQDTCLCTLQLEVYYRYLPTFKTPEAEPEVEIAADKNDEVTVDIDI